MWGIVRFRNVTGLVGLLGVFILVHPESVIAASGRTKEAPSSISVLPPKQITVQVTPALEAKIVRLFSEGKYTQAAEVVPAGLYSRLRPLVLAIVAFCEPKGSNPEELFRKAETQAPSDDLIYYLHARYRWKHDHDSADELWGKVILLARSPVLRRNAQDYLDGDVDDGDEDTIAIGAKYNYYLSLDLGFIRDTNPGVSSALSEAKAVPSRGSSLLLAAGISKSLDSGSLAANYVFQNNRYFDAHFADFLEHDADFPLALRVGPNEDLTLRPFGSFISVGNSPYQVLGGVGVLGVAYRQRYKQSVQGSVFEDRFYTAAAKPQQGTHFRFEYNWDLFPDHYFFRFSTFIEHVAASADVNNDPNAPQNIVYSHNEIGLHFFFDYDLKKVILGFYPRFTLREDGDDSSYPSPSTGNTVTKRREDFTAAIRFNAVVPLSRTFQLFSWYEWNRTYSNIGAGDYADLNTLGQVVGVGLRTFLVGM